MNLLTMLKRKMEKKMKIYDKNKQRNFAKWCVKTGNVQSMSGAVSKKALQTFRQKPYYIADKEKSE